MMTATVLQRVGASRAYLAGFGLFAVGSLVCAIAPVMPIMLVGRGFQGLGAGLLTGLGFALIQSTLPPSLWSRGSAVVSAMFGLGNFVGPAVGGALAQIGQWRWAFAALAVSAIALGAVAVRLLRAERVPAETTKSRVPVVSLSLAVAAVGAMSVASLADAPIVTALSVGAAALLMVGFVFVESRSRVRVLPPSTYAAASAMRWVYLTIALLASAVAVETFLPLFGQQLGNLPPLAAGFYGAALSLGWAVAQIWSASARGRGVGFVTLAGPAVLALGLATLAALVAPDASGPLLAGWLIALVVAGAGIGIAMPHLTVGAMSIAADPAEAQQAAASVAIVLTLATATGSAVAGLLFNIGHPDLAASARYLFVGFAGITALGVLTAIRLTSRATERSVPTPPHS